MRRKLNRLIYRKMLINERYIEKLKQKINMKMIK
jgi:hypothetical protein